MTKDNTSSNSLFESMLLLTVITLPLYIIRFSLGPIPTTAAEALIYLTFIVGIFSKQIKPKYGLVFYLSLLFILAGLISVFIDPELARAAGLWKAYFLDGFLLYVMVGSLDKRVKNKVFMSFCISATLTAAVAVVYYLIGIRSQDGRLLDLDRLSPNYLSMFLVPAFVGSVFLSVSYYKKDLGRLIYFALCSVIIGTTLYLTGSRGVYLALPIGLVLMFGALIKEDRRKIYNYLAILFSGLVILSGLWFFRPSFGDMGRTGSSSNIRYYIWTTSLEIVAQKPVSGVGLSNFQDYFTALTRGRVNYSEFIAPQALTAHNLYLHLYLTTGILGILSFLALVFVALKKSKNLVVIALVVSILVYGLVDTPFFRNDLAGLFWILLALL